MNWKKLNEVIAFNGWRQLIQKKYELPDKKQATFDIIKGHDFVTVAAFTTKKEAIILKQFRPGPEKILTGFPTGNMEEGETPMQAANRELEEETGYRGKKIIFLKKIWTEYRGDCQYCFIALDCEKIGNPKPDETEFIEMYMLPLAKLKPLLINATDDAFADVAPGFLALDYLSENT